MNFVCPKCAMPLSVFDGAVAKCQSNHSYDRAKAGYYNLLLSSAAGTHGDNREMVEARRNFLDTGAYKPLADKVAELAARYVGGGRLLDIGCGEGYYTDIIQKRICDTGASVSAFDISRDAVKYAHKRNPCIELAVASAYHMPVADSYFDCVVNMFSPLAPAEIHRALKDSGVFIMAIPGENHLFGLKRAVYETPYKNEVSSSDILGFELISTERISYNLTLDEKGKIKSLFMMTPYAYRTREADKKRLFELDTLTTEIEFIIFVYKKVDTVCG